MSQVEVVQISHDDHNGYTEMYIDRVKVYSPESLTAVAFGDSAIKALVVQRCAPKTL